MKFSWTFSGLDLNGNPWDQFEYWLMYVDGLSHSALPAAAVTPVYVPGVSTVYTADLTQLDPVATRVALAAVIIPTGQHSFSVAAVGGGAASAPGPGVTVQY